jgi:lipoate-protein ligase A
MHGEYKVPGGKLVVVDLEVRDGASPTSTRGDFFLEPDDALADIDAAVTGLPVETDAAAIAAASVPRSRGRSCSASRPTRSARRCARTRDGPGWKDFTWEIVHEKAVSPRMNLALDEVLTARVGAGLRNPTLRIWEWNESAVVIGSFQSYRNEVDPEGAARHGFDVVRRISGGGAMMMGAGSIVTYSLYVPASLVAGMTFADSYAFLDDWVLQALRSLGVDATTSRSTTSPPRRARSAGRPRSGSRAAACCITRRCRTTWTVRS